MRHRESYQPPIQVSRVGPPSAGVNLAKLPQIVVRGGAQAISRHLDDRLGHVVDGPGHEGGAVGAYGAHDAVPRLPMADALAMPHRILGEERRDERRVAVMVHGLGVARDELIDRLDILEALEPILGIQLHAPPQCYPFQGGIGVSHEGALAGLSSLRISSMWQNFQSPPSLRNLDSYQPPIQVS